MEDKKKKIFFLCGDNTQALVDGVLEFSQDEFNIVCLFPENRYVIPDSLKELRLFKNHFYLPQSQNFQREFTEFLISSFFDENCYSQNLIICTHSDVVFLTLRLAVQQGVISNSDVEIRWFEKNYEYMVLPISPKGTLDFWPKGLFDIAVDLSAELLFGVV